MFVVRLGLFEHFLYVRSPFGAIKAIICMSVVRLGNVITSSGPHQASCHPAWYTRKMTKNALEKLIQNCLLGTNHNLVGMNYYQNGRRRENHFNQPVV